VSARRRGEIGLLSLVAILFFNVSGGPYGLEDAVGTLGPGLALVLLVVTPLVWSLPVALAMAELAAALPEEGGYVVWVQRAFGRFWGFQVGWWSWINSFVDVAVYPALFADYVGFWRPDMSSLERGALVLAFIWILTAVNLAGVRMTGWVAVAMAGVSLVPVIVLTALAGMQLREAPWRPFAAEEGSLLTGLGLGLAIMMWNYSGWDAPTTTLGETRDAGPSFRRAVWVALHLITLAYVLPVAASLSAVDGWEDWDTGHWPAVAEAIGGPWLAHLVAVGAVIATAGLFLSLLLTNSRLPYALALAGQMPAVLGRLHPRFGTPWGAVVLSSAAYSLCAFWSFKELIVLNVWLYSITLVLELAAFVALRLREPGLPRPWRVGGGRAGMWLVAVLPSLCCLLAMATAGWLNTAVGVAAALTGPLAYLIWRAPVPRAMS
jgi:amino acid transporter